MPGGSSPSGSTTTTQVSTPWSGQQPYLTQGFQSASDMFFGNPSATGNASGAPATGTQSAAKPPQIVTGYTGEGVPIYGDDPSWTPPAAVAGQSGAGPSTGAGFGNGLGTGTYDPLYFGSAGTPYAGQSTVSPFTGAQTTGLSDMIGAQGENNPSLIAALTNAGYYSNPNSVNANNPGNAGYDVAGASGYANPANSLFSGTATAGNNYGTPTLEDYASGKYLTANNPAWDSLVSNVSAATLPGLESTFTQGGTMNNPAAAYAVSNGLTSALAPYAEQNYNTQTQNQIGAANTLAGNSLSATSGLSSGWQNAVSDLMAAAQGKSTNYNTAGTQGIQDIAMLPGLTSANTNNAQTTYNVGAQEQAQNQAELNNLVNMYNYNTNLPLNLIDAYNSMIAGNYGGTSTLTSPYYQNQTANILGMGAGAASVASSLLPLFMTAA